MMAENEFQHFGKKLPYEEPEGFFESISEKTLLLAKSRARKLRIRKLTWLSVGVAASMTALIYLVPGNEDSAKMPMTTQIAQESKAMPLPKQEIKAAIDTQLQTKQNKKSTLDTHSIRKTEEVEDAELLGTILASLSDEDLRQMEAMYKTDTFLKEALE